MDKNKWSDFVSKSRTKLGMTLHEFGDAIGTSWVTIWRWENEYCMPKIDALAYWKEKINNA